VRLSYTTISLLRFFLITFLTLFLRHDARAQSMLAVNFSHRHFSHDRPSVEAPDDSTVRSQSSFESYNEDDNRENLPTVNFPHNAVFITPAPNPRRIFTAYHPPRMRIYSASIQNSMRLTVKFFKVVIVPLWYARGTGQ